MRRDRTGGEVLVSAAERPLLRHARPTAQRRQSAPEAHVQLERRIRLGAAAAVCRHELRESADERAAAAAHAAHAGAFRRRVQRDSCRSARVRRRRRRVRPLELPVLRVPQRVRHQHAASRENHHFAQTAFGSFRYTQLYCTKFHVFALYSLELYKYFLPLLILLLYSYAFNLISYEYMRQNANSRWQTGIYLIIYRIFLGFIRQC